MNQDRNREIGSFLKTLRLEQKPPLTQPALARKIGKSLITIKKVEAGEFVPTYDHFKDYLAALGQTPEFINETLERFSIEPMTQARLYIRQSADRKLREMATQQSCTPSELVERFINENWKKNQAESKI